MDIFSSEYARFIMPTADELKEETYIASLSDTEKQLYQLRREMLDGKIPRYNEVDNPGRTCYEDAVDMTLFWARDMGEITEAESDRLYEKYVGRLL